MFGLFAFTLSFVSATYGEMVRDVIQYHKNSEDQEKCFTSVQSRAGFGYGYTYMCDCGSGCRSGVQMRKYGDENNQWNIGGEKMVTTALDNVLCVIRKQSGHQQYLMVSTDNVGSGCITTMVSNGLWWADNSMCVYTTDDHTDFGQQYFMLTSNTSSCSTGWRRYVVLSQAYAII
jgi:hypothetical protein